MEENQFGIFLLSPLAAVTLAISIYSSHECTLYSGQTTDLSPGARIRKYFFGCLALASFFRFLSIIFELVYLDDDSCGSSVLSCLIIRYSGDILYISVYSVLILHWAALLLTTSRSPFAVMRLFLVLGNVAVFTGVICIFTFSDKSTLTTNLWMGLEAAYMVLLICMISFGAALLRNVPVSLLLGRNILNRLIILGSICTGSIFTGIFYYFAITYPLWICPLGFPHGLILPFDFCKILILETVPSISIIMTTLRRRTSTPGETHPIELNYSGYHRMNSLQQSSMNYGSSTTNTSGPKNNNTRNFMQSKSPSPQQEYHHISNSTSSGVVAGGGGGGGGGLQNAFYSGSKLYGGSGGGSPPMNSNDLTNATISSGNQHQANNPVSHDYPPSERRNINHLPPNTFSAV